MSAKFAGSPAPTSEAPGRCPNKQNIYSPQSSPVLVLTKYLEVLDPLRKNELINTK